LAYARTLRFTLLLAVPAAAAAAVLGPTALRLAYGDQYGGTRPVLLVMVAVFPLVAISFVATAALVALGKIAPQATAATVASVVDVGAAAALVPRFDAIGAAVANDAAQLLASVMLVASAARVLGGSPRLGRLPHLVVVTAACAALAVVPVLLLPASIAVPIGLLVFVGAFLALGNRAGVVDEADAEWAAALFGRRARGIPALLLRRLSVA